MTQPNATPIELKRKPKLRWWWFLLIPILLFAVVIVRAILPSPPITIGPDTTVISEPLDAAGLPDYAQHLMAAKAEGVTPENNAAVLLWRALWPGELTPNDEPVLVKALEMDWPDPSQSLQSVQGEVTREHFRAWLTQKIPDVDPTSIEELHIDIAVLAATRTWETGQLEFIDDWALRNQKPLDWLVEAAGRPKYYSPPPNYLSNEYTYMFALHLPDVQMFRGAVRDLRLRAMWHTSHGRYEDAWKDILACHQFARHCSSSDNFIVHLIVAFAVESMANEAFLSLLDQDLPETLLKRIAADYEDLQAVIPIGEVLASGERFGILDAIIRLSQGRMAEEFEFAWGDTTGQLAMLAGRVRIDWNIAMRDVNRCFDKFEEAAKLPVSEREQILAEIDEALTAGTPTFPRVAQSVMSTRARSEAVSDILLSLMVPSIESLLRADDQAKMERALIQIGIALARYRAAHGEHPETLDALVPAFIKKIPIDIYSAEQPIYDRRDDGFLLYSVFKNKIDDQGTALSGNVVRGEYVEEPATVDLDACDLVIRQPVPRFQLPPIPLVRADDDTE